MAANTAQFAASSRKLVYGVNNRRVTGAAGGFRDGAIPIRYLYRFGKSPHGEVEGMAEAVTDFRPIFAEEIVWRVAVITHRHASVAGPLPAFQLLPHDVAVRTRGRIVGEIRGSTRVD